MKLEENLNLKRNEALRKTSILFTMEKGLVKDDRRASCAKVALIPIHQKFEAHDTRKINGEGDGISKARLQLENGIWHIPDLKDNQYSEYFIPFFLSLFWMEEYIVMLRHQRFRTVTGLF